MELVKKFRMDRVICSWFSSCLLYASTMAAWYFKLAPSASCLAILGSALISHLLQLACSADSLRFDTHGDMVLLHHCCSESVLLPENALTSKLSFSVIICPQEYLFGDAPMSMLEQVG